MNASRITNSHVVDVLADARLRTKQADNQAHQQADSQVYNRAVSGFCLGLVAVVFCSLPVIVASDVDVISEQPDSSATEAVVAARSLEPVTELADKQVAKQGKSKSAVKQVEPEWDPIEAYDQVDIEGWTILVNRKYRTTAAEDAEATLKLLGNHLYQITRRVPAGPLEKLKQIRIWVEENHPKHPCMCYHVSPDWLRENGMNPEKAGCVELSNARNFRDWTLEQPWMVLHELAHGYHDRFIPDGYENSQLKKLFQMAMDRKAYDSVPHVFGESRRGYATTNPMEYFAEASEAFFGTNDQFPYVTSELQQHDPDLFDALKTIWESPRTNAVR